MLFTLVTWGMISSVLSPVKTGRGWMGESPSHFVIKVLKMLFTLVMRRMISSVLSPGKSGRGWAGESPSHYIIKVLICCLPWSCGEWSVGFYHHVRVGGDGWGNPLHIISSKCSTLFRPGLLWSCGTRGVQIPHPPLNSENIIAMTTKLKGQIGRPKMFPLRSATSAFCSQTVAILNPPSWIS